MKKGHKFEIGKIAIYWRFGREERKVENEVVIIS